MDAVDVMIRKGLTKIKEAIVVYMKKLKPGEDTADLKATPLPWDFDWDICRQSIANAAERTAHHRFVKWLSKTFRGVKRGIDDLDPSSDFIPSTPQSGSSASPSGSTTSSPSPQPSCSNRGGVPTKRVRRLPRRIVAISHVDSSVMVSDPEDYDVEDAEA